MTVTSLPVRDEFTATASQTVFNYTFKIFADGQLNVYITPSGQEANDSTDITTAYTIDPGTIGNPVGGFITLNSGASSGDLVTIVSNIPEARTTDYQNSGDFLPETVNDDFDTVVSLTKQQEDRSSRTLSFQESLQNATALTLASPVAGLYLAWNSTATGTENVGAPGAIQPSELNGTTAQMVANASLLAGEFIITSGRTSSGDGGGSLFLSQTVTGGSDDGGSLLKGVGNPGIEFVNLFPGGIGNLRMWGVIGDGVIDDTIDILAALTYGSLNDVPIYGLDGDIYLISSLIIPINTKLLGSGFNFLSDGSVSGANQIIKVLADCEITELILDVGSNNPSSRALEVGDRYKGRRLIVTSVNQNTETGNLEGAIQIRGVDVDIDYVEADKFDNGGVFFAASGRIGTLKVSLFRRGFYVRQTTDLTVERFVADQASPNATLSAGQNALLMESSSGSPDSTSNIRILDIDIDGSGEHGIRLGGDDTISDVYLGPSIIRNTGSCGIKILGGGTTATTLHRRIVIAEYNMWDLGQGVNDNQCGLLLMRCQGLTVASGSIRKVSKTFSVHTGIRIEGCFQATIDLVNIEDCESNGLIFDSGNGDDMDDVTVAGGNIRQCGGSGIVLDTTSITMRRVKVMGKPNVESNAAGVTVQGGGTLTDCLIEAHLVQNTLDTQWASAPACLANFSNDHPSAAKPANGSTSQEDGGSFYIMKGAVWTAL